MKKIMGVFTIIFTMLLTVSCFGGDVPDELLFTETAQVYFGKVVSIDGEKIAFSQTKKVKGAFTEGNILVYEKFSLFGGGTPKTDEIYLCGAVDKSNSLYVWKTTGTDTKNVKISSDDSMSKKMEKYLNDGEFDKKEQERIDRGNERRKNVEKSQSKESSTSWFSEDGVNVRAIVISCVTALLGGGVVAIVLRKKK